MHITEFTKHLQRGREELLDDGITISDETMLQHYMEQINNCGLFSIEQMIHWEEHNEECKTVIETTTYFEEVVDSIGKFKENSGSAAR